MAARSALLLMLLGIALGIAGLPLLGPAQVFPISARRSPAPAAAPQLDSARLAAMQKAIQDLAKRVKADDLAKLPSDAKPLHPLFPAKKAGASERNPANPFGLKMKLPSNVTWTTAEPKHAEKTAPKSSDQAKPANSTVKKFSPSTPSQSQAPERTAPILPSGYHPSVFVSGPGRLDWTFVISESSLDPAPSAMTAGYLSTRQTYELFVPPNYDPRRLYPMIIHVTAGPRSDAWAQWQQTCRAHNVILAGAHNAGNAVPLPARVRIVLDVLDDVRRRFHIDPDRTYISGMSGGGMAAAKIAFALPELFGGFTAICGCWNLRAEPMLRQRVSERLSVAVLTGAMDFNRPELEREFFPILREHGARSIVQVYPGLGHGYPNAGQLEQVFRWMEQGLLARRFGAALFPASHLMSAPSPNEWSTAVVVEAGRRLEMQGQTAQGLFLLQGVVDRWQGLPAATFAQNLLNEFDKTSPVPWREIYRNELLRFRYLQARMFDPIVNGPLPANYPVPRTNLARISVWLWTEIQRLSEGNEPVAQEANNRLAQLHRMGV